MRKHVFAVLSLIAITAMLLTACAPAAAPTPAATQAPAQPAATEAPKPAAATCTDKIGCVTVKAGDPIHIAYALVVAGENAALGTDSRNGVEIAIDDKKEIMGHKISLTGEDTGCSAEGGQAAGTKLASDATIVGIIGTSCSSEARVAMPLFSTAGFVVVSPSNTAPDLTEAGNKNNFPGYLRTAHNDKVQGAAAAKFAWEKLSAKKAATIHDGSLYADKLQQVFAEEFKKLGGTITNQEAIDPKQTDMGPVLTTIAANKPDLIYYPIFLPAGALINQKAKQTAGLEKTALMGADGLFSPDVVKSSGDAINGFYVSSPFVSGDAYDAFVKKYKTKFGIDPSNIFHAHAYDAANMIFAAIEKAAQKGADGSLIIGRQAVRDAIYATKDFTGLTGKLSCTPSGDCANPVIAVYQYQENKYPPVKIWP
jgi:branched-chain amino acid transport system substrate-binding protein